jgi:cytochrome c biogenesis protein CcdA
LVVLPSLLLLILFNVADDLGKKRILSRLLLFPAGVVFIFGISIVLIRAFPTVFLLDAHELDIIWGLLLVWLGYAVARREGAFVIRAARENFLAWCYGTFMMGILFGALWMNYLSTRDLAVLQIYSKLFSATSSSLTYEAVAYAFGLGLTVAGAALLAYLLAVPVAGLLRRHRVQVKWVVGPVLALIGAYFIFNDVWALLRMAGLVL